MQERVDRARLSGRVRIPASKSHTIRALIVAALANGRSRIQNPLDSDDIRSCISAARLLGARVVSAPEELIVDGTAGRPGVPDDVIDVGNSGTTLYLAAGAAALVDGWVMFTGDRQIRRRPIGNLISALNDLGAECFTTRDNGCVPAAIRGRLSGGSTCVECPTSQYLSSLLLSAPLAEGDSTIDVPLLNERPYVEMTLGWLDEQGVVYRRRGLEHFEIPGGQGYKPFTRQVPADFSSATFFLCAAAITRSTLVLDGLDMGDTQGDKHVIDVLREMGCGIEVDGLSVRITGKDLTGGTFDLNAMPDALPALAATACFAHSDTHLVNVPQARAKETDRIHVMAEELRRMDARIEETPDGLTIHPARLKGAFVDGHGDHRIVMALSIAGLGASGSTIIDTAETAAVTYPSFYEDLRSVIEE